MITDTLKQAAQALRDTKPELAAALEAMAERPPVAWRRKRPNGVWGYATAQADDDGTVALDAKWEPLYAAPVATPEHDAKVRDAALEEAAKVCDELHDKNRQWHTIYRSAAANIRHIKSTGGAA